MPDSSASRGYQRTFRPHNGRMHGAPRRDPDGPGSLVPMPRILLAVLLAVSTFVAACGATQPPVVAFDPNAPCPAEGQQPGAYPDGLTLFRAEERLFLSEHPEEEDLGWSRVVSGPVEIHPAPGNHLSLMAEPNVRELAERLRLCLDRALAREVESVA